MTNSGSVALFVFLGPRAPSPASLECRSKRIDRLMPGLSDPLLDAGEGARGPSHGVELQLRQ